MTQVELRVDTSVLLQKAGEMEKQINAMQRQWSCLCSTIQNSNSYWVGEAGDKHREFLKEFQDEVGKLLKELEENPNKLLDMAGVYKDAENAAEMTDYYLGGDVIV